MSADSPTPDRDGFPARIPEYVFTTAAIVTAEPGVKSRLPWFRRAVESAFMNGYEAGRKRGRDDAAKEKAALLDALRRMRDTWYRQPGWTDAADIVDVLIDAFTDGATLEGVEQR